MSAKLWVYLTFSVRYEGGHSLLTVHLYALFWMLRQRSSSYWSKVQSSTGVLDTFDQQRDVPTKRANPEPNLFVLLYVHAFLMKPVLAPITTFHVALFCWVTDPASHFVDSIILGGFVSFFGLDKDGSATQSSEFSMRWLVLTLCEGLFCFLRKC